MWWGASSPWCLLDDKSSHGRGFPLCCTNRRQEGGQHVQAGARCHWGSPWSDVAVYHALDLARTHGLAVCLLCVDSGCVRSFLPSATSGAKNTLALAEARAAAAGVTYEAHLAYGNVAEAILETAVSWACDAIVLGSRGLTGFKRLMLGSISNAVTAKTLLPVLIVKRFFLA